MDLHHRANQAQQKKHSAVAQRKNSGSFFRVEEGYATMDETQEGHSPIILQQKLNERVARSPQVARIKAFQDLANRSNPVVQRMQNRKLPQTSFSLASKAVIQMVSRTTTWQSQKAHYQGWSGGAKRLPGDALWLAMVRYARNVPETGPEKSKGTVNDVLAYAQKNFKNGVSFDDWKGSQSTSTSNEAQHLVNSSYATQTLKWPYALINSEKNGKMLMAGRSGKGVKMTPEYSKAKATKPGGKGTPARGVLHIGGGYGFGHPHYSAMAQKYAESIYAKHGLTVGQDMSKHMHVADEIMDGLRAWHKQFDRDGSVISAGESVDTLSKSKPIFTHPGTTTPAVSGSITASAPASPTVAISADYVHEDANGDYYFNRRSNNPDLALLTPGTTVSITPTADKAGGTMTVSNHLPHQTMGGGWVRVFLDD